MWKVIPCNFKKGGDTNKWIWVDLKITQEQDYSDCEYHSNDNYIKYSELIESVISESNIYFEKIYDWKNISEQNLKDILTEINNFNDSIVAIVSQYEENDNFDEISLTPNYILSLLKMEKRKISKKIKSIITWFSLV